MVNVSKFIRGLTKQFVVVKFSDKKDARKSARHNDEPAVDVDVQRLTDQGNKWKESGGWEKR